jgi:hypothetical protein
MTSDRFRIHRSLLVAPCVRGVLGPLVFSIAVLVAAPGRAVDGVVEIGQSCATGGGCFSGDTAGFPVTIDGSAGNSYRLTSDLVVPDENTDAITIAAPSITIDLNGFDIVRAACANDQANCGAVSGSGSGIEVDDTTTRRGCAVYNGSVTAMGQFGVLLGQQAQIRHVRARWNGLTGLGAGAGSVIAGNTAYENGGAGIACGDDCLVEGNTSRGNIGAGIVPGSGSGYVRNVVSDNAGGTFVGGISLGGNGCDGSTICP